MKAVPAAAAIPRNIVMATVTRSKRVARDMTSILRLRIDPQGSGAVRSGQCLNSTYLNGVNMIFTAFG